MRFHGRTSLVALLAGAIVAVSAPAAQAAFGVESFFGANCGAKAEACTAESTKKAPAELFTQAAGHPDFGITDFTFNESGLAGNGVKTIRTDLPPGVSTNPQALPLCTMAAFEINSGKNEASHCGTEVGEQKLTVVISPKPFLTTELVGTVYNLEPAPGLPLEFGIDINAEALGAGHVHSLLEGGVSWHTEQEPAEEGIASGDYHEFFKIKFHRSLAEKELPLVRSRLVFNGKAGKGLLTNPSACIGPQTTHLWVEPFVGSPVHTSFTSPVGTENCNLVPFEPSFTLTPGTTQSDQPDGVTAELKLPQHMSSSEIESSDLQTTTVTLPEGMTINPSAAHGLEGCTPEQIAIGSANAVSCPVASELGTAAVEVPGLPAGALTGHVYLGKPSAGPITGPPYTIYIDAESARYGQALRLKGSVIPNPTTGRLTATFSENPEHPFSAFKLNFTAGALAPLANPLACGTATTETILAPFTGAAAQSPFVKPFVVDSNNAKGACPSPLPFSPTQSTQNQSPNAGARTSYSFTLARSDGQQYLSRVKTVLPPGLVGEIPAATRCGEPQAKEGTCSGESRIGTATVSAGAGPTPYSFSGPVYLTGPYNGAPFGLSIAVPAVAGPFNLGTVVTRATLNIDPYTARVSVASVLPTIVKGLPLRVKSISVAINKQGFLLNPTNCGVLATESALSGFTPGSSAGATRSLSSPFQVGNCNGLAFKPSLKASTFGKPSKANGASLETTINQGAGQSNIKSVRVQLPRQLPSRLTTLQKACPEATFAADPLKCPSSSFVGGARANTPLLPGKMTGPAILVSHAAAAFPDLDLLLEANGVRTILVGNTFIKNGITTTSFAADPDVPISSITINLPTGPHSALAAAGDVCANTLVMPTTIVAQNGKQVRQNTKISRTGCPVKIVGRKVIGNTAFLTVQTYAAGRISGSGAHLATVYRYLNSAADATSLKVPLARRARRPLRARIRVGFVPKQRGAPSSTALVTVTFG